MTEVSPCYGKFPDILPAAGFQTLGHLPQKCVRRYFPGIHQAHPEVYPIQKSGFGLKSASRCPWTARNEKKKEQQPPSRKGFPGSEGAQTGFTLGSGRLCPIPRSLVYLRSLNRKTPDLAPGPAVSTHVNRPDAPEMNPFR